MFVESSKYFVYFTILSFVQSYIPIPSYSALSVLTIVSFFRHFYPHMNFSELIFSIHISIIKCTTFFFAIQILIAVYAKYIIVLTARTKNINYFDIFFLFVLAYRAPFFLCLALDRKISLLISLTCDDLRSSVILDR